MLLLLWTAVCVVDHDAAPSGELHLSPAKLTAFRPRPNSASFCLGGTVSSPSSLRKTPGGCVGATSGREACVAAGDRQPVFSAVLGNSPYTGSDQNNALRFKSFVLVHRHRASLAQKTLAAPGTAHRAGTESGTLRVDAKGGRGHRQLLYWFWRRSLADRKIKIEWVVGGNSTEPKKGCNPFVHKNTCHKPRSRTHTSYVDARERRTRDKQFKNYVPVRQQRRYIHFVTPRSPGRTYSGGDMASAQRRTNIRPTGLTTRLVVWVYYPR